MFSAGVDVLLEKPIATTLAAGKRIAEAARANGRLFMVNHKRSADQEMLAMRAVIRSGEIGRPRLVNRWHGTNWMFRPRAAEELAPNSVVLSSVRVPMSSTFCAASCRVLRGGCAAGLATWRLSTGRGEFVDLHHQDLTMAAFPSDAQRTAQEYTV